MAHAPDLRLVISWFLCFCQEKENRKAVALLTTPTLLRISFPPSTSSWGLLASASSLCHEVHSRFYPSHLRSYRDHSIINRNIVSVQGSAPYLTLPSNAFTYKTAATGDPLRPNYAHIVPSDCGRSSMNEALSSFPFKMKDQI